MKGPIDKICEGCHRAFECGQYGCWCGKVEITVRQMEWIEREFKDCLCPSCLQKVIDGELGPDRVPGV